MGWKIVGGIWINFGGFFTIVKKPPLGKCFLICLADFYMCIIDHCNDAEVTTAMLPISVRYLCRNTKCRADFSHYLKRFIMDSRFLPSSQYRGRCTTASFQISLWCENGVAARHYDVICKQLLSANDRNRGSLSSCRPPTGWGLHRFVWKSQRG